MPPPPPLPRLSAATLRRITLPTTAPPPLHHHNHHQTHLFTLLNKTTTLPHLKQIHAQIILLGLHHDSFLLTKLIRSLSSLLSPYHLYSSSLFRSAQLLNPNPFLSTALIRGFFLNGFVEDGFIVYKQMRRDGVTPTSFTYCCMFKGCVLHGDVGLGRQLHGEMFKLGGFVFDHAGNALVDMYVKFGVLGCARKVFDEMPERDVMAATSLIVAYAKCGMLEEGRELFFEMEVRDVVVWSAMITAYVQNARPKEALELFERMERVGVEGDEFTLAGVISACAQLGTTKYATRIRDIAERQGCGHEGNVVIGSALVDMYAKCGRVDEAYEVFKGMRVRNVYSYSSMIKGFAVHSRADAAMQLFYEMEGTDIRPNQVTFVGVLTACSHGGLVDEGRRLFYEMEEKYGVTPTADHYTCMVDLLGRSGHLEEALSLAKSLPSHPHGSVWGALLGACSIHKNPDIAEIAASHLFEIEPNNAGNYVLLSNTLASSGRWDSLSRVQKLIKEKGLKKYPARSWVEGMNGTTHEFFASDLTHPRFSEIKQVLEELMSKLKLYGYQPNLASVSYDVSDDDKRQILMNHSEKLALAFELLTTEGNSTITIMKNLRICEDCHVFMCSASKITGREIVVRDNMRFHHFSDGVCSCGNFW